MLRINGSTSARVQNDTQVTRGNPRAAYPSACSLVELLLADYVGEVPDFAHSDGEGREVENPASVDVG